MRLTQFYTCVTFSLLPCFFSVDGSDATEANERRSGRQIPYSSELYNSNDWGRVLIEPYHNGNDEKDNHKPTFINCSSIQPTIKEEQPTGSFVYQVHAVDKDPDERGGNITYSFIAAANDQMKFHIDPWSGVITTKHMFNRDEPTREKEVFVTVRALDNGKPQLDDVCKFKVIIEDINDNAPTFDKMEYRESIPQDMPPTREVLRLSATDIDDGDNRQIYYVLIGNSIHNNYFEVHNETGVVKLHRTIMDKLPGYEFKLQASATDRNPDEPKSSHVNLIITVVESNKKTPYFTQLPAHIVYLMENFTDYAANIASFVAESHTDEGKEVRFYLVTGNSEQTNKQKTFRLVAEGNTAHIRLGGAVKLDYETISEYTLTVRVENKYSLAAEHTFTIQLEDVNDMIPYFSSEVNTGMVLENEPIGTPVMQVNAVDGDISYNFKKITYSLDDNQDKFSIDPDTGNITTRVTFDREEADGDVKHITVTARDSAPSALFKTGEPNSASQVFRIIIADRNDNPPTFTQRKYEAEVAENQDLNALVIEVLAKDKDSASTIQYALESEGNTDGAFYIVPETGRIKVNKKLDYEKITAYTLGVRAYDGLFSDTCQVYIKVQNVNDNAPVFTPFNSNLTLDEEQMYYDCLTTVQALDPDIQNIRDPQRITFSVLDSLHKLHLTIDEFGCLKMLKALDRDWPGFPNWNVRIAALDEGGLGSVTEVRIHLNDINDNAPTLNMPKSVVWRENQEPGGAITTLIADDIDGPENGYPFSFQIAKNASHDILDRFSVTGSVLNAKVRFDREYQKEYRVPIAITDSGIPAQTGIDYLTVIIGDENDNKMKPGSSSIFVYSLEGQNNNVQIGRVYVEDEDDWDLPDKTFFWDNSFPRDLNFELDTTNGTISMFTSAAPQSYLLQFVVHETSSTGHFPHHVVSAVVNVTLKQIPLEAVEKSGSIRFEGIADQDFIRKNSDGLSKADVLKSQLALALNNSEENVDVFTVLHSPRNNNTAKRLLDVRFSSHGSPYYSPERINTAITKFQAEFENLIGLRMVMVNVDECLRENVNCQSSCWNHLEIKPELWVVNTNKTSFVGVYAYIEPMCDCRRRENVCMNGGTMLPDGRCQCSEAFEGPYCEQTSIGFSGNGWALYPPIDVCENARFVLYVRAAVWDGLIFYIGPDSEYLSSSGDFIALQLHQGYPVLLVDYGSGTASVEHYHKHVVDDEYHKFEIILKPESIELKVDNCQADECINNATAVGTNKLLNVNGPLQLGGTYMNLENLSANRNWQHRPSTRNFKGCIRNFTVNNYLYNLGAPSLAQNADASCSNVTPASVVLGFDWSFFIAVLICLFVMSVLLTAVVIRRRKTQDMYKDTDDIRENIINYEDEGGGEGDTAYDLDVLRMHSGDGLDTYGRIGTDDAPDICRFLNGQKDCVDNDPECLPFDDVRHYAYEGDGNTSGSLSSLASGTDEGDLNFEYLSNFGPRFRKLADMYGEDASDEDSDTYHNNSQSWG